MLPVEFMIDPSADNVQTILLLFADSERCNVFQRASPDHGDLLIEREVRALNCIIIICTHL